MSYKTITNSKKMTSSTKQQATPFCKVCYDAKRPGYDTHYLKDFTGPTPVVVCPYLLELKCNYCKNSGHTVSYCDVLKAKKSAEEASSSSSQQNGSSQNGRFFIMREGSASSMKQQQDVSAVVQSSSKKKLAAKQTKKLVRTAAVAVNQFEALLAADEESSVCDEEEETASANQTTTVRANDEFVVPDVVNAEEKPAVTWAKIVANPSSSSGKKTAHYRSGEVIMRTTMSAAALYERPNPKFIHNQELSLIGSSSQEAYDSFIKLPGTNVNDFVYINGIVYMKKTKSATVMNQKPRRPEIIREESELSLIGYSSKEVYDSFVKLPRNQTEKFEYINGNVFMRTTPLPSQSQASTSTKADSSSSNNIVNEGVTQKKQQSSHFFGLPANGKSWWEDSSDDEE